ncbi:ATP-binding cassette glutathione S-conjugate transporter ycf1, partial [Coemansia sp. RSA 2322]
MNSTIRESILFGLTYDPLWYAQVVDSCELLSDLDRMAAGDQTVVGTGGMALSGGQRVRVALARAVYSRPGLVFLDDFLVSVDTHVARRIIDRVLLSPAGLLASAARVIVTQSPAVLSAAHGVCIVDKGRVSQPRPLSELLDDAGTDFCAVAGIST